MISKEEIKESKKRLQKRYDTAEDYTINQVFLTDDIHSIGILLKYIEKLETREKNLTWNLVNDKQELTEELKYNFTKREAKMQLNLIDKYLKIMKGENDES